MANMLLAFMSCPQSFAGYFITSGSDHPHSFAVVEKELAITITLDIVLMAD